MLTNEIASAFNIQHRDIMRMIKVSLSKYEISESSIFEGAYTSVQNKQIKNYKLSDDCIVFLLSSKLCFSNTVDRKVMAVNIIESLGYKMKIILGDRVRSEEVFYSDLAKFCGDMKIIRQYPVKGYLIDFFIPELNLFIEYNEPYHFTETQKEKDKIRLSDLEIELTRLNEGIRPCFLIVTSGKEVEGLRKVACSISLVSSDLLLKAINQDEFLL